MREDPSFAYSLSQSEDGWRWRVFDEDGVTVADGAHTSQDAALAAVNAMLRNAGMDLGAAA
ncbi:hypothetical protein [uncultured Phenylobacterium sp.]|uniref:hypothetical protein n=1 Tax=uncultured Phenylobacterium sp. TaxID=349273 RepID=UPI0025F2E7B2|nr:hypothetical protein [uncultured Phenylobacterium sp.]